MSDATSTSPAAALGRLIRYAHGYRRRIVAAVTCSILNKVFDLAPPVLIGAAVDVVVKKDESFIASLGVTDVFDQLVVLGILTVIVWALESAFEYAFQLLWRNLSQALQHDLRIDAYAHTQRLDTAWFQDRSTGGLMAVLNDDINQLERFLDGGANSLLQVGTTVIVVGATFFAAAPLVAVLAVLPVPIILWGSFRFQHRIAPRYKVVRERVAALNGQLANNLSGIATIRSFVREDDEVERIRRLSDEYKAANREAIKLSSAFIPLIRMAIVVGFTATLILGGWMTQTGALEVGVYSVLVFLTQRLLWPLTRLGETLDLYQRAMASTTRVLDLIDVEPTIVDGPSSFASPPTGTLHLDGVRFGYVPGRPVLDGVDLTFPAGETTAIVGATGSGKSTIVKLLLRFHDVEAGAVRFDGLDIRELGLGELREAIGLVSQDVYLFDGTIAENIAYGRPDAPRDAIIAAAEAAEAHEFISALPDGYDTVVGERGQKLSGGQRQRLSIARAVLKDPPVLILDEATSAVDNETEAAIQRSMRRIAEGRTTIVIAHRLSTVRDAHTIHVLDDGEVIESGTHDVLTEHDGIYARLWAVQTGERIAA